MFKDDISGRNITSDGTTSPPTNDFIFYFDTDKFDTVLSALKTKYPEITCNDDKSKSIRSAVTVETSCKLRGESSELRIANFESDGKLQSVVYMRSTVDDAENRIFRWISIIVMLLLAYFVWARYFSRAGVLIKVAREAKQNETKMALEVKQNETKKALEIKSKNEKLAKMTVALDIAEKSKKRITERIKTNITAGELEKSIGQEFKTISQNFDVDSLTLEEIDESISKDIKVKVIEVSVTRVGDEFLVSVKYKPDHFSENIDIKNDERGFWIIQGIISFGFWIYYGIFYAFLVLIGGLLFRAIKNSAFPNKLKSTEIEPQIERCLKNLKNEFSIS